jgi:beta-lysine 5,6-aminomutase alpha subunit
LSTLDRQRARRARISGDLADPPFPWVYLTVGAGDIDQAIAQAQAAARDGADVIAVIRSAGQALLDHVPAGGARDGQPGSYATGENFRAMRAALDQTSRELGRYVRLTSYASGLCMPEITTLAGLERLDMMLSDCMHGIIVRDINPLRTFIDQRFSRAIGARAGIVVSPGEEDFLAPAPAPAPAPAAPGSAADAADCADAADGAVAVIVSQLLNEYFGREAGLETWQLGFGLMPEGVDLPFRADRDLALANIRYVRAAAGRLGLSFAPDSLVVERAHQVLDGAVSLLRRISTEGLLNAIADGTFGAARRPPAGGHGLNGVVTRADGYFNPVTEILDGTDEGAPPLASPRVPRLA